MTTARRRFVSEAQLEVVVDQMLESKVFHVRARPFERMLYINCMVVIFQLIEGFLAGENESINFMGHAVRFNLEPQPVELVRLLAAQSPVKRCTIDEDSISELVEELLADDEMNNKWVPDIIERQLYLSVLRLVIRVAEEVVSRLKLNVLGREVNMSILSQVDIQSRENLMNRTHREEFLYTGEEEPLRLVSTTELEERVKGLEAQRQVLVALKHLGGIDVDLTEDSPVLQRTQETTSADPASARGDAAPIDVHEFKQLALTQKLARSFSIDFEVDASIEIPFSMIADLTTYNLWMPWCTGGRVLGKAPDVAEGVTFCSKLDEEAISGVVGFGFETGTFLGTLGDNISYRVASSPPGDEARVIADAVNGFSYGDRLVYDWRFRKMSANKTKVNLDLFFQAHSVLYMPLWDSMQTMIVNNMLSAFKQRAALIMDGQKSEDQVTDLM
eukprot:CAMPEP_0194535174 /NCGR_PEP_ID=MMETSP0253-20130528/73621_1 /TAXON_ID=2966 /ORGANISM="Noctiluca scintillans" /LENGTH=444 /DNA_ID=CAMNT_0039380913 /DNA_START=90 /DNA_END=1424 /DNA_ORIENTATION=-